MRDSPEETNCWEGFDLVLLGILRLVNLDKEDVHLVQLLVDLLQALHQLIASFLVNCFW